MTISSLSQKLYDVFEDETLYGFCAEASKSALVTLMPFPDLKRLYNPVEFYEMLEGLRAKHSFKISQIKVFLEGHGVEYITPPATPGEDGELRAKFSYKWAACRAGLGFIGKNSVFTHFKYGQRVRISCLIVGLRPPAGSPIPTPRCGSCEICASACPNGYITGRLWHEKIKREELIAYKSCAEKSRHLGPGAKYSCAHCALACPYPFEK